MHRINSRPQAKDDVVDIADFLSHDSENAAVRFTHAVDETLLRIGLFPMAGWAVNSDLPELTGVKAVAVRGFPRYLIFFLVKHDHVEVVRIMHGARDYNAIWSPRPER